MQKFLNNTKILMVIGAFLVGATSFAGDPAPKTGETSSLSCPASSTATAPAGSAGSGQGTAPAGTSTTG